MRIFDANLPAGQEVVFYVEGRYFRVLNVAEPVTVAMPSIGIDTTAIEGIGWHTSRTFDHVRITSAKAQRIIFAIHDQPVDDSRASGEVRARILRATAVANVGSVTVSATAKQVVAAKASRSMLHIRNAGAEDVYLGGPGVTVGAGAILLEPGEELRETDAAAAAWYAVTPGGSGTLAVLEAEA